MKGSSICFPRWLKGSNRLNVVRAIFGAGLTCLAGMDAWCHDILLIMFSWCRSLIGTGEFLGIMAAIDGGTMLIASLRGFLGFVFSIGPCTIISTRTWIFCYLVVVCDRVVLDQPTICIAICYVLERAPGYIVDDMVYY